MSDIEKMADELYNKLFNTRSIPSPSDDRKIIMDVLRRVAREENKAVEHLAKACALIRDIDYGLVDPDWSEAAANLLAAVGENTPEAISKINAAAPHADKHDEAALELVHRNVTCSWGFHGTMREKSAQCTCSTHVNARQEIAAALRKAAADEREACITFIKKELEPWGYADSIVKRIRARAKESAT